MKRITAAVLSALLLCAAPLSYADDTVADMEAKQTELANKNGRPRKQNLLSGVSGGR